MLRLTNSLIQDFVRHCAHFQKCRLFLPAIMERGQEINTSDRVPRVSKTKVTNPPERHFLVETGFKVIGTKQLCILTTWPKKKKVRNVYVLRLNVKNARSKRRAAAEKPQGTDPPGPVEGAEPGFPGDQGRGGKTDSARNPPRASKDSARPHVAQGGPWADGARRDEPLLNTATRTSGSIPETGRKARVSGPGGACLLRAEARLCPRALLGGSSTRNSRRP